MPKSKEQRHQEALERQQKISRATNSVAQKMQQQRARASKPTENQSSGTPHPHQNGLANGYVLNDRQPSPYA